MSRSALTVQKIVRSGLTPSYASANAAGHSLANPGARDFVHVKNGGGSPITVTIETPGTVDGLAVAERTVTVADSAEAMIGPFPQGVYNQPDGTDNVYLDFSGVVSVTIGAFTL